MQKWFKNNNTAKNKGHKSKFFYESSAMSSGSNTTKNFHYDCV